MRVPRAGAILVLAASVAAPPILVAHLLDGNPLLNGVKDCLERAGGWTVIERYLLGSWVVYVVHEALGMTPGLAALARWRRAFPSPTPIRPPRWVTGLSWAAGGVALAVFLLLHALFGVPTYDIGQPDVTARVPMEWRLCDVALNSLGPGILEEYYWRAAAFPVLREHLSARATIVGTALAFGVCHEPSDMLSASLWGLAFGALRECTGSWLPGMAAHVAWNAVAFASAWHIL